METQGRTYSVAEEVFALCPGYMRGVVLAYGVSNPPSPAELVSLLREAERSVRERLEEATVADYPRVSSWREAYRAFGAKPRKHRPSMEAMARRVLRGQDLPSINALADIGNVVSLRHIIPVGGHAVDVVQGDIELRPARGDEEFSPFGSEEAEHPEPGEIIMAEGNTVVTRRWTWRQANHTLLLPDTTALEVNVDGLPPVPREELEQACRETASLIERFCGGRTRIEILDSRNPWMSIEETP